jgi:hypothetical protein
VSNERTEDEPWATELARQRRSQHEIDLWPDVSRRIRRRPPARALVLLGVLLLACRFLDVVPGFELLAKLLELLAVVAILMARRDNPLRIVTDPRLA